jgi:SAM-dependent methyltransferase
MTAEKPCPICGCEAVPAGEKHSDWSGIDFRLAHCRECEFSFVVNPRTDFEQIYNEDFYSGRGADPIVDYFGELADPTSIRLYEWRGLLELVRSLIPVTPGTRWLDFGCGLGGFVRYARAQGLEGVMAYETGFAADRLRDAGVPNLSSEDFPARAGSFDVVTSIEVLEHAIDPLAEIRQMAQLLRPGGLLFVTTGNAAPHRADVAAWDYVLPDVHISFFEPKTLATAFERAGLRPEFPGFLPGHADVIRFRVLKVLHRPHRGLVERLVPWPLASRVVDRRVGFTAHPVGWRV